MGISAISLLKPGVSRAGLHEKSWRLFGTDVEVSVLHPDSRQAATALDRLFIALAQMNRDWHPWAPGQMQAINSAISSGEPVRVNAHIEAMLTEVQRLYRASAGSFNPAIGNLAAAWGFHGEQAQDWQPPAQAELDAVLASRPSPLDLHIDDGVLTSTNKAVRLDFGGYAKGYALEAGMQILRQAGIEHAMIDAGGDVVALGSDGMRGWQAGVPHPYRSGIIARIESGRDEAVFTSRNLDKFNQYQGVRYTHVLDPRTGRPADQFVSATVVHDRAAIADAAATALIVAGIGQWESIADAMGVEHAILVDRQGGLHYTSAMAKRVSIVS
jgi:thiamine biosynthesis lipoprotein